MIPILVGRALTPALARLPPRVRGVVLPGAVEAAEGREAAAVGQVVAVAEAKVPPEHFEEKKTVIFSQFFLVGRGHLAYNFSEIFQ